MTRRLVAGAVAAVLGLVAIATLASPAQAQAATGTVTVIHGIPGVTVDVYVDDVLTLPGFTPTTVAGPLELPAATYSIEIFAAGADPATATPVITASVPLPAGANASLIANLDASGTPVLSTFVNDTAAAAPGEGRLVVRHTAAAPAVDVLAGGTPVFTNLTNPNSVQADLPAGTVQASVNLAGTATTVIGPAPVTVEAGMATIVYAIGSAEDQTLGVVVQMVPLAGPQLVVQTGTSGLQDQGGLPMWAVGGLLLSLSALAGTVAVAGRRARA